MKRKETEINLGQRKVTQTGTSLTFTIPSVVVNNCDVDAGDLVEAKYDGNNKLTYTFREK